MFGGNKRFIITKNKQIKFNSAEWVAKAQNSTRQTFSEWEETQDWTKDCSLRSLWWRSMGLLRLKVWERQSHWSASSHNCSWRTVWPPSQTSDRKTLREETENPSTQKWSSPSQNQPTSTNWLKDSSSSHNEQTVLTLDLHVLDINLIICFLRFIWC